MREKRARISHEKKNFCVLFGSRTRQCDGEKLVNISQDSIYINLIFRFFAFSTPTRRFAAAPHQWRNLGEIWELNWAENSFRPGFFPSFVFIYRHHHTATPHSSARFTFFLSASGFMVLFCAFFDTTPTRRMFKVFSLSTRKFLPRAQKFRLLIVTHII